MRVIRFLADLVEVRVAVALAVVRVLVLDVLMVVRGVRMLVRRVDVAVLVGVGCLVGRALRS